MQLRWTGISLLIFDVLLMIPRSYLSDTNLIDIVAIIILATGIVLIRIDCKKEEIEYISKIKKEHI